MIQMLIILYIKSNQKSLVEVSECHGNAVNKLIKTMGQNKLLTQLRLIYFLHVIGHYQLITLREQCCLIEILIRLFLNIITKQGVCIAEM